MQKKSNRESQILDNAVKSIKSVIPDMPDVAVISGSGLKTLSSGMHDARIMDMSGVSELPVPAVSGHGSRIVCGRIGQINLMIIEGRVHLYEGYNPAEVVRAVRTAVLLGAGSIILTNAAGCLEPNFHLPVPMLITDQINLTGRDPMMPGFSPDPSLRFTNLDGLYSKKLLKAADAAAGRIRTAIVSGVYAGVTGPSYETEAEAGMLHKMGASAVGMSTVLEAIAAKAMGAGVLGISALTNMAAAEGLSHEEVKINSSALGKMISDLITRICMDNGSK